MRDRERFDVLALAFDAARTFLSTRDTRRVFPSASLDELRASLGGPLPDGPADPARVVGDLARAAEPGIVATAGPRYFGFVTGGSLPAALGADWLASAWDQNAALYVSSPAAAVIEEVAGRWLLDVLGLPATASVGFVTGCHMANFTALATARAEVLRRAGHDVAAAGLAGCPPVTVLVGDEVHVSVTGALRMLGIGTQQIVRVPANGQGRMRADALASALDCAADPAIVCAQAGNVNTGAFDPLRDIVPIARRRGAWVHVDGAFGLWAGASRALRHLVEGAGEADSWATDGHKWLNVPYDSGLVFTAHPAAHRAAMSLDAAYLVRDPREPREAMDWVPESSRRARALPVYAALRSLGRSGVEDLVNGCCALARRFADRLRQEPGVTVLNEVVLNQVLARVTPPAGDADEATRRTIARVQQDGVCWLGGTRWHGMDAMRLSVSNWSTTAEDVDRSLESIVAAVRASCHA